MKLTKKFTTKLIEAAIFAEGKPISVEKLRKVLPRGQRPPLGEVRQVLDDLQKHYKNRGVQLVEVASGFRFQVCDESAQHLIEQKEEKPLRMSKAFMETLALTAYRQPITRGEIEDIRGVAVSSNIIRSLLELEWIREVGHKDVPGKPALFATTKKFLDFFNLKSLGDLPPLAELQALSETRLEEEFEQLNLALGEEFAQMDEEAQRKALARQNFVGPMPQVQESEDSSEIIAHDSEEDLIDLEAQDAQDEALDTDEVTAQIQEDAVKEAIEDDEVVAQNEWEELEEEADFDEVVEIQDDLEDEPTVAQVDEDLEQAVDEESIQATDEAFEALDTFEEQDDMLQAEALEVISEIDEEALDLNVEQAALNHKPLEEFSEIVLTQRSEDKDNNPLDEPGQAVGDDD